MTNKIERIQLVKTIFEYGLIRIPSPAKTLPKYLFDLPKGASTKVKIKYNTEKAVETKIIHNKISGDVFGLAIPNSILKKIQYDFYYSWAIIYNKSSRLTEKTGESFEIVAPKSKSGYFHIKNLEQKHDFDTIKNIIIEKQKTYNSSIKGKLIFRQSEWIHRSKLNSIKSVVSDKPAIYYLTNEEFSEFYIGQSKNRLDRLKDTGSHQGMNDWHYFRYTQYNLDMSNSKHINLLGQFERDHIHNLSRMLSCEKVKTSSEYSLQAFYTKVKGSYKPVKILNIDWVGDKK